MYRKIDDYESECNFLRRENESLKRRLKKMQDAIGQYQIEKKELQKKLGVKRGPRLED